MLSFYLCGLNMRDMVEIDFCKDYIQFLRIKTEKIPTIIRFTIQPEAREILNRLTKNEKLFVHHKRSCSAFQRTCMTTCPE